MGKVGWRDNLGFEINRCMLPMYIIDKQQDLSMPLRNYIQYLIINLSMENNFLNIYVEV